MKRLVSAAALAVVLAAAPAWAADQSEKESKVPMNQLSLAGSDIITKSKVHDAAGNKIGSIESLVVDTHSGQVSFVIISANGKDVAVPWDRLQAGNQPETFVLNADKTALDNAPKVDRDSLAQLRNPDERKRVSAFWENLPQTAQTPGGKDSQER
jgi:sporulation protein YlmC with PRC-barrel domain